MPVNLYYTQKGRGFQQENVKYSKESAEIHLKRTCNVWRCSPLPPRLRRNRLHRLFRSRFSALSSHPSCSWKACQDVKKAVSETDGLLKSGGAEETRTLDPHTASVML